MKIFLCVLFITLIGATQTAFCLIDTWQLGIQLGRQHLNQSREVLEKFKPQRDLPQYQRHPQQEKAYNNSSQLNNKGQVTVAGQTIQQSAKQHPIVKINKLDEAMKKSQAIKDNPERVLGNTEKAVCSNRTCPVPKSTPDTDFNQAVSALSGANDAASNLTHHAIFSGKGSSCKEDFLSFRNCCRDKGWGMDLGLAHCSNEEKQLGKDKENGLTIDVGRYCAHHMPWPFHHTCTEHRRAYCRFSSKLGRIIQQQGRKQLDLSFGEAKSPRCRGLSAGELQHINFDNINFKEYYSDLHQRLPKTNPHSIAQTIASHVSDKGRRHEQ